MASQRLDAVDSKHLHWGRALPAHLGRPPLWQAALPRWDLLCQYNHVHQHLLPPSPSIVTPPPQVQWLP